MRTAAPPSLRWGRRCRLHDAPLRGASWSLSRVGRRARRVNEGVVQCRARRSPSPTIAPVVPTRCRSPRNAITATDLRQIKGPDDAELISFDPALRNTATCRSAITYLDGRTGTLRHRGYAIEDLATHGSYLEVAYLILEGELPNRRAARRLAARARPALR